MKKNILIIGPFSDFGGRELESSFIGDVLSETFNVTICSTGYFSDKSQLYNFENKNIKKSLLKEVYDHNLIVKIISIILWLKHFCRYKPFYYSVNRISKKYFNIENKINLEIEKNVNKNGVVLICAQLTSTYLEKIVSYSYSESKKVVFRTTGVIDNRFETQKRSYIWLNNVSFFLNHSNKNSILLKFLNSYNFLIIDQCAYNEKELIKIPILNKKVKSFLTISRLTEDKNIDVIIKSFLLIKEPGDKLFVVGDGPEFKNLVKIANGNKDIVFTGYLENKMIAEYIKLADCILISHYYYEAGPLTGIEAMASARIIISAKTGAMEERMPFNDFWFDNSIDNLVEQFREVKNLSEADVINLSTKIRNRYLMNYSIKEISRQYLMGINNICE